MENGVVRENELESFRCIRVGTHRAFGLEAEIARGHARVRPALERALSDASPDARLTIDRLAGFIFLITQYFQFLKAYSPFGTGLRILPVAICIAAGSVAAIRRRL